MYHSQTTLELARSQSQARRAPVSTKQTTVSPVVTASREQAHAASTTYDAAVERMKLFMSNMLEPRAELGF